MRWTCKLCTFSCGKRQTIIKHYSDSHRHFGQNCPLPCVYTDCAQYFRSKASLKSHLRAHKFADGTIVGFKIKCSLCDYNESVCLKKYISHLGQHLKKIESLTCPFSQCPHKFKKFSTFTAHKCRCHPESTIQDLKPDLLIQQAESEQCAPDLQSGFDEILSGQLQNDCENEPTFTVVTLQKQIEERLSSLFLRLQAVLHVSQFATQEIVNDIFEIGGLIQNLNKTAIENVIRDCSSSIEDETVSVFVKALQNLDPLCSISENGLLSSAHKRLSYFKKHFNVIEPVEFVLDLQSKKTFTYVSILDTLQALLNRTDIIERFLEPVTCSKNGVYTSLFDGLYFKWFIFQRKPSPLWGRAKHFFRSLH